MKTVTATRLMFDQAWADAPNAPDDIGRIVLEQAALNLPEEDRAQYIAATERLLPDLVKMKVYPTRYSFPTLSEEIF